jgi:hypothetical protein
MSVSFSTLSFARLCTWFDREIDRGDRALDILHHHQELMHGAKVRARLNKILRRARH